MTENQQAKWPLQQLGSLLDVFHEEPFSEIYLKVIQYLKKVASQQIQFSNFRESKSPAFQIQTMLDVSMDNLGLLFTIWFLVVN